MGFYENNERPIVSIIICVYNVEPNLFKCLESISQQTIMPNLYEIILVDDASTDNSLEIAKQFQRKNNKISIIENRKNLGPGFARNKAINHAKGEYINFLTGDDYLDPIAIESMLMSAIDNQSDLVISGHISATENGDELFKSNFPPSITVNKLGLLKFILSYNVSSIMGNLLIKKSLFSKHNLAFPVGLHKDFSLFYKIAFYANNVYIHQDYLYYWVKRKGSTADSISTQYIEDMINGVQTRVPFLINNAGKGFLRKVDDDLQIGFYKATLQMFKRIINCEGLDINSRSELFLFLVDKILDIPEGYESITKIKGGNFVDLVILVHNLQTTGNEISEIKKIISKELSQLLDKEYITEAEFLGENNNSPKIMLTKTKILLESVRKQPGSIFTKISYLLSRVIEFLKYHFHIPSIFKLIPKIKHNYTVLFVCEADYHIRNAAPIIRNLKEKDISVAIIDKTNFLSGGKRALQNEEKNDFMDLKKILFNKNVYSTINYNLLKAVVFFNDWGESNSFVRSLRTKGISTIGINEGVNDFLKLGEGFTSRITPYRTCEYAILPGKFDTQFFIDRPNQYFISGLPKINQLYKEPVTFPSSPLAVINVNFTYSVLTYYRDLFIRTAIEGCKKAGIDYVLTQHPMDNGDLSLYNVSEKNMYDTIKEGTVFISRFSGAIIESLALGKPCVYHNPHNEQIRKFQEPLGAYSISFNSDSLAAGITHELNKVSKHSVREYAHDFLDLHANISETLAPNEIITQIIIDKI